MSLAAAKGARQLVSLCRVRKDIGDPHEFVFAIAYVLNDYPAEVIAYVTDPVTGLPGTLKFPLEISDVKRALRFQMSNADISREAARETAREKWDADREQTIAAARDKEAERRRDGPPWPAVMRLIKEKTVGRLHNNAEREFRFESFSDGVLTILTSTEGCERAKSLEYFLTKTFPGVTQVHFTEAREAA